MDEMKSAYIEQGWQCPLCKAVMSPRERVCVNCKGNCVKAAYDIPVDKNISYSSNIKNLFNEYDELFNKISEGK